MKKFLVVLVVLILAAAGGYYAYKKRGGSINLTKEKFAWGVTMRPHALNRYSVAEWRRQIDLSKKLGVDTIRIGWQEDAYNGSKKDPIGFHKSVFKELEKASLDIYLVVEPKDFSKVKEPYKEGYELANLISTSFSGKIKYYQLLNESGSGALKGPEFSGEKQADYDNQKYNKVRDWIKGAASAIRKNDPKARIVVNDQWTHYYFFTLLEQDKVDYDYIGWDWFSDMGLMYENKLSDGQSIMDKLKQYNKPIILSEVQQRPDGENGQDGMPELKQSEFIEKMAKWARNEKTIKGFLVLELTDVPNSGKNYVDRYGLVEAEKDSKGNGEIGEPRKAYYTYQEIISGLR